MKFCECNSGKYRWRDVALINGKYYRVDEGVYICENEIGRSDSTFDIEPIEEKIAEHYGVETDDVVLATFSNNQFPQKVIDGFWDDKELGGYCAVCGGDI